VHSESKKDLLTVKIIILHGHVVENAVAGVNIVRAV
jgi:hypothetical protein